MAAAYHRGKISTAEDIAKARFMPEQTESAQPQTRAEEAAQGLASSLRELARLYPPAPPITDPLALII
jgi:hypothetical protein